MIFRTVGRKHPICRGHFKGACATFWDPVELSPVPHALVAYSNGYAIAWHRYMFDRRSKHFYDAGIWVEDAYRCEGVARKLYTEVLSRTGARIVTVSTLTEGGRRLIASLVRDLPAIAWCVEAETWRR